VTWAMGEGLQGKGEGYTVSPSKPKLGEHKTSTDNQ